MNRYVAFILDIKNSKNMSDDKRANCQNKLLKIISHINILFQESLVEKIVFSGGDAVQGLFINIKDAIYSYYLIKSLIYPYEIRCGIGYGKINESIMNLKNEDQYNVFNSNVADGDSYHLAMSALNTCKERNYNILVHSNHNSDDLIINQIWRTVKFFEDNHSLKQKDVFNLFNILDPIDGDLFIDDYYKFIVNILENSIANYDVNFDKLQNANPEVLNAIKNNHLKKEYQNDRIFINEPFSSKMNEFVSTLLNVKRQNIEQIKKSGNFNEIRKLQIIACIYARRYRG